MSVRLLRVSATAVKLLFSDVVTLYSDFATTVRFGDTNNHTFDNPRYSDIGRGVFILDIGKCAYLTEEFSNSMVICSSIPDFHSTPWENNFCNIKVWKIAKHKKVIQLHHLP